MKTRKPLFIFIALFAVLLFVERPASWLFDPDEARYADIPQSMLSTGDFLTPKLNGSNYFEKPPLLYWLNALSMRALGDTPFAARLPVRLATLATALLLLLFLRSQTSSAHLWGALIFLSALGPGAVGRINLTDGIVSLGIALTLLSSRAYFVARGHNQEKKWPLILMGMGASIGVLSKGLIGIVLPGLVLVIWASMTGQGSRLKEILFSRAALLFFILTAPWFILMEVKHPGFSRIFFIREHLLRYATNEAARPGSVLYFVPVLILGMAPWTFFLFSGLKSWRQPEKLFFAIWLVVIFIFFSLSRSKLIPYLLPAFPAAAMLSGYFISDNLTQLKRPLWLTAIFWSALVLSGILFAVRTGFFQKMELGRQVGLIAAFTISASWLAVFINKRKRAESLFVLSAGWAALYLILISVVPRLATHYSFHDMAVKAKDSESSYVVAYGLFPHGFPVVFNRPIPVVNYQGELASDGILSPDLFWTKEKFFEIWNSTQSVAVVYGRDQARSFVDQKNKPEIVTETRKCILAVNQSSNYSSVLGSDRVKSLPKR